MNKRLKIISILFGLAYLFIIAQTIYTEIVPTFEASFMEGWNSVDDNNHKNYETCHFKAIPKNGRYAYPSSILNLKTNTLAPVDVMEFYIKVENPPRLPVWLYIANGFNIFFSFVFLFLIIYIPVQAYKVIASVVKKDIFDLNNIRRLRMIGYSLLITFILVMIMGYIWTMTSRSLVELEDYKILFSVSEEYFYLLFGLIVLLFAEVLKISHKMKEEVDLTV